MDQYRAFLAETEADFQTARKAAQEKIERLEEQVTGPFFNGPNFSLVDAAFAPAVQRFAAVNEKHDLGLYENAPKVKAWGEELLKLDAVRTSVLPEFDELWRQHFKKKNAYIARFF